MTIKDDAKSAAKSVAKGGPLKFMASKRFIAFFSVLVVGILIGLGQNQDKTIKDFFQPLQNIFQGGKKLDISMPKGFPTLDMIWTSDNETRVGWALREEGLRPKYPVIIIPGFVTTGLELWHGDECARKYFRTRLWAGGNLGMAQTLLSNVECWLHHMRLDSETGLDADGVHLRPAQGLEAVDYFVPGYAVWAKMIASLADLGYTSNNLITLTYDWRLAIPNLEIRDRYFTQVKNAIEQFHRLHSEKVLIASHSWGDNVFRAYMQWADHIEEGWTDKHIAVYVNIAGPVLGVPKAITAFLSGETRDTADLGLISKFLGERFVPARTRAALFRTWGAGIGMLPSGGPAIWGNSTWAPDDTPQMRAKNRTFGAMVVAVDVTEEAAEEARRWHWPLQKLIARWLQKNETAEEDQTVTHHSVDGAIRALMDYAGPTFERQSESWSSSLPNDPACQPIDGKKSLNYYYDPLKCPLPNAPKMHMYCLYGVGKPVERAYHYLHLLGPKAKEQSDKDSPVTDDAAEWRLNTEQDQHGWTNGVRLGDGDGTVPIISTGLLCRRAWRQPRLNPGGIRVKQREYAHEPVHPLRDMRGGPRSSDHVDVLGNVDLMEDVLRIAAGQLLGDNITSSIDSIVEQIKLPHDDEESSWSIL